MEESWDDRLPDDFRSYVIEPVDYSSYSDADAQSQKLWGMDQFGMRCFYRHEFTVSEDRFDSEEFPIQVDVFWESVTAWRLSTGQWLKLRKWTSELDRCPRTYVTDPPQLVNEDHIQA